MFTKVQQKGKKSILIKKESIYLTNIGFLINILQRHCVCNYYLKLTKHNFKIDGGGKNGNGKMDDIVFAKLI